MARMEEEDDPLTRPELVEFEKIRMPAATSAVEPRVGEVPVFVEVVGLVRQAEVRQASTAQLALTAADSDAPSARSTSGYGLGPVEEELVVVKAEPMGMPRTVRGRADDIDTVVAQPVKLGGEVFHGVDVVHELERDEVVVQADLVAELLEPPQRREEPAIVLARAWRGPVVAGGVEGEVRCANVAAMLQSGEPNGAVEALVHIVPQADQHALARLGSGKLSECQEFEPRICPEPVQEAFVAAVGEAPLERRLDEPAERPRSQNVLRRRRFPARFRHGESLFGGAGVAAYR